jgi:hypothetical protein
MKKSMIVATVLSLAVICCAVPAPERDAKGRLVVTVTADVVIPIRRENGDVLGEIPISQGRKVSFLGEDSSNIRALLSNKTVLIPKEKTNFSEVVKKATAYKEYKTQEEMIRKSSEAKRQEEAQKAEYIKRFEEYKSIQRVQVDVLFYDPYPNLYEGELTVKKSKIPAYREYNRRHDEIRAKYKEIMAIKQAASRTAINFLAYIEKMWRVHSLEQYPKTRQALIIAYNSYSKIDAKEVLQGLQNFTSPEVSYKTYYNALQLAEMAKEKYALVEKVFLQEWRDNNPVLAAEFDAAQKRRQAESNHHWLEDDDEERRRNEEARRHAQWEAEAAATEAAIRAEEAQARARRAQKKSNEIRQNYENNHNGLDPSFDPGMEGEDYRDAQHKADRARRKANRAQQEAEQARINAESYSF